MMKSRRLLRSAIAAMALVPLAAPLAAAPVGQASAAATRDSAAALDTRIDAEIRRLEDELDPVSASVVRNNQAMWEAWLHTAMERGSAMVADGQGSEAELADAAVEIRRQRLRFLEAITTQVPDGVAWGWADGLTEVLLLRDAQGHAKLATFTNEMGGRQSVCVIAGKAVEERDGITITPDRYPDRPIHVRRKGIALSVEDMRRAPGATLPFCNPGGKIAGDYFYIEGLIEIAPWLIG